MAKKTSVSLADIIAMQAKEKLSCVNCGHYGSNVNGGVCLRDFTKGDTNRICEYWMA